MWALTHEISVFQCASRVVIFFLISSMRYLWFLVFLIDSSVIMLLVKMVAVRWEVVVVLSPRGRNTLPCYGEKLALDLVPGARTIIRVCRSRHQTRNLDRLPLTLSLPRHASANEPTTAWHWMECSRKIVTASLPPGNNMGRCYTKRLIIAPSL